MDTNLSSMKSSLSKCGKFCVAHTYLVLILFLLIDLLIVLLFFWQFYLNLDAQILEVPSSLKINQMFLDNFTEGYQIRETDFNNVLSKTYLDPFTGFR